MTSLNPMATLGVQTKNTFVVLPEGEPDAGASPLRRSKSTGALGELTTRSAVSLASLRTDCADFPSSRGSDDSSQASEGATVTPRDASEATFDQSSPAASSGSEAETLVLPKPTDDGCDDGTPVPTQTETQVLTQLEVELFSAGGTLKWTRADDRVLCDYFTTMSTQDAMCCVEASMGSALKYHNLKQVAPNAVVVRGFSRLEAESDSTCWEHTKKGRCARQQRCQWNHIQSVELQLIIWGAETAHHFVE